MSVVIASLMATFLAIDLRFMSEAYSPTTSVGIASLMATRVTEVVSTKHK